MGRSFILPGDETERVAHRGDTALRGVALIAAPSASRIG